MAEDVPLGARLLLHLLLGQQARERHVFLAGAGAWLLRAMLSFEDEAGRGLGENSLPLRRKAAVELCSMCFGRLTGGQWQDMNSVQRMRIQPRKGQVDL